MKYPLPYIIAVISILLPLQTSAQQWEFGANFGGSGYMGDINPGNPLYYNNIGGGLHVKYNFDPTWGIRVGGNYIGIGGSDQDFKSEYQQNRNLYFNNKIWEFSALGEFHFFRFVPNYDRFSFTPYLFAGLAAIHHNPYIVLGNEKHLYKPLQLEQDEAGNPISYSSWSVSIPYGFGLKYNLRGPWTIGAEIAYRTAFTNSLDNVSGNYRAAGDYASVADPEVDSATWEYLADPSVNRTTTNTGRPRGSGGKYDGYMTAGITITYSIVSTRCYWW